MWDWVLAAMCVAWLSAMAFTVGVPGLGSRDAPAWVQAIGSIAAILVAVALASWQHRRTEDLNRQARRAAKFEKVAPLRALVDAAAELSATAQTDFGWLEDVWEPDFWKRVETEFEEVSVMNLADYAIARDLLTLQRAYSALLWGLGVHSSNQHDEMTGEGPPVDPDDLDWFTERRATIASSAERITSRLLVLEDRE